MYGKSTHFCANAQQQLHQIPAGMFLGDVRTELFGDTSTKKVYAISDGQTIPFQNIDPEKRALLLERFLGDEKAMEDLKDYSVEEAIEHFAFCNYGAADSDADFCHAGNLKESENFLCSSNCRCLKWNSKNITLNGHRLTPRKIEIIQLLATDMPDKQIADTIGISASTLDTHKSQLFEVAGVNSKAGLIVKCMNDKII